MRGQRRRRSPDFSEPTNDLETLLYTLENRSSSPGIGNYGTNVNEFGSTTLTVNE